MYYKLSNTASRSTIEKKLGVTFKYPRLHQPNPVIFGMDEELLPVITQDQPTSVNLAIWGMLPTNYKEDWETYQSTNNTLNTKIQMLSGSSTPMTESTQKRCLIIVTGYFVSHMHQGELYPYFVHLPKKEPFTIAGIYSKIDDGFLTTSLLVGNTTNGIPLEILNLCHESPLVITQDLKSDWLEHKIQIRDLEALRAPSRASKFTAYPIAKEFYYRNIKYYSMLDPVFYDTLPMVYS